VCVKRKRVVELVIVRCVRLSKNQAEIRQKVVPPVNRGRANSLTLFYIYVESTDLDYI
jgi:hypothetical protein